LHSQARNLNASALSSSDVSGYGLGLQFIILFCATVIIFQQHAQENGIVCKSNLCSNYTRQTVQSC